ncbi:nucleotidyltransferase family protein [Evansella clarkii]|uniref:nucleotidyltransferase domain-containing protein n=1 Tax=Evansella clarkii TaxID=79879 RepID=UPI000996FFB1|nr:nucleotidyltransferase family protein [Evansella clarkii]
MDKDVLNLERVPKELKLILQLIKGEKVSQGTFKEVNWERFIELSVHHRLYPVLYTITKQLHSYIPETVINQLFHLYQRNTFSMLQLTAEMEQVSKLFNKQNIPVIFLKGPMLADELYGDISKRTCSDLDFLIPMDELEKAEDLLAEHGYEKNDYIKTVLNDWKWRHHHVTYFHPQKGIKLEVHWRLHPGPGKEPVFRDLWERKSACSLTNFPVYMLGREDLILYLSAHGARHGWSRLRWLMDIHQLLREQKELTSVIKLSKRYQMYPVLGQAMVLSSTLLNSNQPEGINATFDKQSRTLAQKAVYYFENMVNLHTDPVPAEVSVYHESYLLTLMPLQQKLLILASFFFPYPEDAETLPLPKFLHFLYFPLRPFIWGWRKSRKQHAVS